MESAWQRCGPIIPISLVLPLTVGALFFVYCAQDRDNIVPLLPMSFLSFLHSSSLRKNWCCSLNASLTGCFFLHCTWQRDGRSGRGDVTKVAVGLAATKPQIWGLGGRNRAAEVLSGLQDNSFQPFCLFCKSLNIFQQWYLATVATFVVTFHGHRTVSLIFFQFSLSFKDAER